MQKNLHTWQMVWRSTVSQHDVRVTRRNCPSCTDLRCTTGLPFSTNQTNPCSIHKSCVPNQLSQSNKSSAHVLFGSLWADAAVDLKILVFVFCSAAVVTRAACSWPSISRASHWRSKASRSTFMLKILERYLVCWTWRSQAQQQIQTIT